MNKLSLLLPLTFLLVACEQPGLSEEEKLNRFLVKLSEQVNEKLPEMVDENTVLETTAGYSKQFTYFYTLLNYDADEVDAEAFISQMTPVLIENACTSEAQEPLISRGVTLHYVYSDKETVEFASVAVRPEHCQP